ncbi:hypothetical protein G9274_002544 [Stenotrophomonas rhizophila]|nr:hypothetical protein G9274_002544 [Stenotrophomonas rhizophila]
MWWDGGDRAITAREKATIEEHGPSCYTIPLLPADPADPADPWRGLYLPARMSAPSEYGDLSHPDLPIWPDQREDALDKLVHAQGFDFQIVAGEFTYEAMDDGDELYWQEMRAWNPKAPEGEWRLAWKGDTEDGPYAWFVRPMALRPEVAALAARQSGAVDERAFDQTIEQRDRYHGTADELADHIARITGVDIGEHSSVNCPWQNAIEAAAEYKPAQGIDLVPRPMDTAPRDGTLVRLLVDFDENAIEDSIGATWTIGACSDDNVSEGARIGWQFAGWCWTHDHFTQGTGTPVGWLPLIDGQHDAAPRVGNG